MKGKELISPLFLELIENLWSLNGIKSYSPIKFRDLIEKKNNLFQKVVEIRNSS